MKRRMNNIFRKDGRSFVLAMDHSAMLPSPDIKEPGRVISEAVEGGADGFLTTYGIIRKYQKDFGNKGIILRADGGISAIRKPMAPMDLLYSAEDAVRIGADAMLCMGYPGSQTNEHTLKYLAELVEDGVNGFKTDISDMQSMEKQITLLLNDKMYYIAMAEKARACSMTYNAAHMRTQIETIMN